MKKVKDHYFQLAKEKNYSARSFFKLQEIDDKYRLIKQGSSILDLGASPGSWSEYSLVKLGSKGKIVAIDLKPLQSKKLANHPQVTFIQQDVSKLTIENYRELNLRFDLIQSDMAPNTTGSKGLNHQLSLDLCVEVVKLTKQFLKVGGNMVCKVFQGEDLQQFILDKVKPFFKSYKLFKPKSSRSESVELYILGFSKKYTEGILK